MCFCWGASCGKFKQNIVLQELIGLVLSRCYSSWSFESAETLGCQASSSISTGSSRILSTISIILLLGSSALISPHGIPHLRIGLWSYLRVHILRGRLRVFRVIKRRSCHLLCIKVHSIWETVVLVLKPQLYLRFRDWASMSFTFRRTSCLLPVLPLGRIWVHAIHWLLVDD